MQKEDTVRRFRTVKIQLSRGTRFKRASPFFVLWLGLTIIMLFASAVDELAITTRLLGVLALSPLFLLGWLVYALNRTQTIDTPEAIKMRAYYESLDVAKPVESKASKLAEDWFNKLEALVKLKRTRYLFSAFLLWVSWHFATDPTSLGLGWEWAVFALCALVAAKELVLWLIGAGLVVGVVAIVFKGMAAMPVSVAVIIGAFIIAGAMKK
jgi:hypothetical protein